MECMRPLSTLALSKFDIARTVQCLRDASLRDMPRFLPPVCAFSSSTSLQSFKRFINNVKYLRNKKTNPYTVKATTGRKLIRYSEIISSASYEWPWLSASLQSWGNQPVWLLMDYVMLEMILS